ncbi:MAG: 6-bladed beta-propeller [Acidimicrobiia bacterium]|nr:6-bladed beta-propeller [Acidimicrobiia bacterium]
MMQPMRSPASAVGIVLFCSVIGLSGPPALHSAQPEGGAPYRLVPGWGVLPNGATWGEVPGMAIDADGRLFAFHRAERPVVELDRSGKILKQWGEKLFAWPHGIRVDRFGNLWITDGQARDGIGQQVFKYSRDGTLLMTLGTKGVRGEGPDMFGGPCDVAVAGNGDIFVADGHFNSRVVKFDKNGTFIKAWGRRGTGPGEFNLPHTIAIDSRGRVLVGDRSNNRIQIFDQDGTFIDQWTQFGTPSGMYIAPDDTLYVVDYNVKKGVFVGSARDGSVNYKLDDAVAEGVAVDRDGNIYVGETVPGTTLTGQPGGHIVRKFERLR